MKTRLLILALAIVSIVTAATISDSASSAYLTVEPAATPPITKKTGSSAKNRDLILLTTWDGNKLSRSDDEWKKELSEMEFYVLRKQGTERAYTGKLTDNKQPGTYHCAACGLALFSSKHKYDSETGWPSFYQPINKTHLGEAEDRSIPNEPRTEVHCNRCGSHLGHIFDDGPEPTGLRYCINSVALRFAEK